MLYYRRKILLALLEAFGGKLSAKSLQKYLFLFTRKQDSKAYDFIPYRYGCFSFQANQDIITLEKYDFLEITETDTGRLISLKDPKNYATFLDLFDRQLLIDLKVDFGNFSQQELIHYTYVNYPYYATKSSIAGQILTAEELQKVEAQKRRFTEPTLFTIGYEGISLEGYINKLIINDIKVLCDIRKNAYSQKYGFSKSQLQKACEGVGISYVHIPELGIDSDKRQDLRSQADYDILFAQYEKTTLKTNAEYLKTINHFLETDKRVAITCFEKNHVQCHRGRVAKQLMLFPDIAYSLIHL